MYNAGAPNFSNEVHGGVYSNVERHACRLSVALGRGGLSRFAEQELFAAQEQFRELLLEARCGGRHG